MDPKDPQSQGEAAWYFIGWRKYATFRGTACRREYWWFQASYLIFLLGIFALEVLFVRPAIDGLMRIDFPTIFGPLFFVFNAYMLLPQLTVACRRLHDLGFSGFFAIVGFLLWAAFGCFAVGARILDNDPLATVDNNWMRNASSLVFVAAAAYQLILYIMFCLPGVPPRAAARGRK